jgi:hypothetical protein
MSFATSLVSFAWASATFSGSLTGDIKSPALEHSDTHKSTIEAPSPEAQPDLLLMDVVYDQLRVDSALTVLQDRQGRRFVPVRQFAATLGFRLHVDAGTRRISGFLNSPSDRLELDGTKGSYKRTSSAGRFDIDLCFVKDGELYLESDLFAKITGLHLLWQMSLLQLEVSSNSPLNVEKQWIQRARDELQQMAQVAQQTYQPVAVPYKVWSVPSIDAQVYAAGAMGAAATNNSTRVSVVGAGDLLMMSARYRVESDSQGRPTTLISLGRSDPGRSLLGSLHANQFEFGDLYLPPQPLLARGRNALGLTFSNFPLAGQEIRQGGQISGHSAPGTQLELYSQDQLRGSAKCDADGNYQFNGLRLNYGPNDLKLVSVTPDGDVLEENHRLYGGNEGPNSHESRYRFTAGRIGSSVYGSDTIGNVQNQDSTECFGEFQRGLKDGTWASGIAALTQGPQGTGEQIGLGIHSWLGSTLCNVNSMVGLDGGIAVSAGITRVIGSAKATLERTEATGSMSSRILPEIGAVGSSLTSLKVEGMAGKASYGFGIDRLDGFSPATVLRARASQGNSNLLFSNSVTMNMSEAPTTFAGFAEMRKNLGSCVGLVDMGYQLSGGSPLQLARVTLNRNLDSSYTARTGLEYDANRSQPLGLLATLYRSLGPLDVGVNFELLQGGKVSASLLFSTGLQGSGGRGALSLSRPGASDSGCVTVRAFVDKHLSGRYEPDDPLLEGVTFLVDGHPRPGVTGKNGRATIDRLSANQQISVSANEESFENPAWVSENPGITTVPRPGRGISIDFPVIETGELEGRLVEPKGLSPPPGLVAQLIDSGQHVSDTSILDASGTYVFSRVRPGEFHIRLVDLSGQTVAERSVSVAPGAILKRVDIESKIAATPTRT